MVITMTMKKVAEILRVEKQCVERSMLYCCDTDCADCDLNRYDLNDVLNAYTLAIEYIEDNVVNKVYERDQNMALDEAIKHAEEVAEGIERFKKFKVVTLEECKCAADHRQLAEWLRELKSLKERNRVIPKKAELDFEKERNNICNFCSIIYPEDDTSDIVFGRGEYSGLDVDSFITIDKEYDNEEVYHINVNPGDPYEIGCVPYIKFCPYCGRKLVKEERRESE